MKKYNKISITLLIFAVLFCISTLGTVSAADTGNNSTGPTVTTNLTGGTYNTTQTAALTANDSSATIYYTNDTTDPRTSLTKITYTAPIIINKTTTLRYAAVDSLGNWSQLYLQNYVIATSNGSKTTNNNGQSNYTGPQINNIIWNYFTNTRIIGSPTVGADGTVYIGSDDEVDHSGKLYAFKPNGTLKWSYNTGGISSAPVIGADGTIYIENYSGTEYAFNPNGTLKWKTTEATINSGFSTIGADGTIYLIRNGYLYSYNPDGTLKWQFNTETLYGVRLYKVSSTPVIGSDGTIYALGTYTIVYKRDDGLVLINGTQFNLYAINPDGTLKWSYDTGKSGHTDCVIDADGTLYFGIDKTLYALNPNGTEKWTYTSGGEIWSGITIGSDGTIYFGTRNNYYDGVRVVGVFYAINSNGTLNWSHTTGDSVDSSGIIGADGTIYFVSHDGYLYALSSDGKLKWKQAAGEMKGSPVIGADGTLYFGSFNGKVYAIKNPIPVANFTANTTNGTGSLTVKFTDTSIRYPAYPTLWAWDFNNDGIIDSEEKNPSYTYSTPGKYTVKLTVTNNYGSDTETKASYITVNVPDTTKPTAWATIKGGLYNTNKTIYLKMNEAGTIYYTRNGSTPTTASTKYIGPISITYTTTLKFFAVDKAGNKSPVYTQKYTIDKKAPKVVSTNPKNKATGVSRTKTIAIKFSEKIKASVNWSKIYVKNKYGKKIKISKSIKGNILYIKTSKRSSYSLYTVYIPAYALKDYSGNKRTVKYTWRFKTGEY